MLHLSKSARRALAGVIALAMFCAPALLSCGGGADGGNSPQKGGNSSAGTTGSDGSDGSAASGGGGADERTSGEPSPGANKKALVLYFSHTGENYNVGVIEKGNTAILAEMISEITGGDLYEIRTKEPYPEDYDECTEVAKEEQKQGARPELAELPPDVEGYETVYLGYPIWWGDMPMAVYSFLEQVNLAGKTIYPFCTHEGSGLSGTEARLETACPGAKIGEGLAVRGSVAQNDRGTAREAVQKWLAGQS